MDKTKIKNFIKGAIFYKKIGGISKKSVPVVSQYITCICEIRSHTKSRRYKTGLKPYPPITMFKRMK